MPTILSSWSGMRKYLEQDMLAQSLRGRIRYNCTTYPGMDGGHIFELYADGKCLHRFSVETVNHLFITQGRKPSDSWCDFWPLLNQTPMQDRDEYTDDEFCRALATYRNQDIQASLHSTDPIVRMFSLLDRRVGKRSLAAFGEQLNRQPVWLQTVYHLREESQQS